MAERFFNSEDMGVSASKTHKTLHVGQVSQSHTLRPQDCKRVQHLQEFMKVPESV